MTVIIPFSVGQIVSESILSSFYKGLYTRDYEPLSRNLELSTSLSVSGNVDGFIDKRFRSFYFADFGVTLLNL